MVASDDKLDIDNESILKEHLKKGINLFTGAGFSVLPGMDGKCLPTGKELADEIRNLFKIEKYSDPRRVFSVAMAKYPDLLRDYLRDRFKVQTCNSDYYLINKINIKAFITTNFDNIPHIATSINSRYRLFNVGDKGKTIDSEITIPFIPLHGCVESQESELYLGDLAVSMVGRKNRDLFEYVSKEIDKRPTLFWGYKLEDEAVKTVVERQLVDGPDKIWIQCRIERDEEIRYYRELGCNVIVGDTKQLFDWLRELPDETEDENAETCGLDCDEYLKKHKVPVLTNVPFVSLDDYYTKGVTEWIHILSNVPIVRQFVLESYNSLITGNNVIIVGGKFSGKTTALMQLARMLKEDNKFFFNKMTTESADYFLSRVGGTPVWVFLENCTDDMCIFTKLSEHKNVHIVSTANEVSFDSAFHLVSSLNYIRKDIPELLWEEAMAIFEKMSPGIRKRKMLMYKTGRYSVASDTESRYNNEVSKILGGVEEEKFSMMELLSNNVKGLITRPIVEKIVDDLAKKDEKSLELVALTTYLSGRGSALSTDIIMSYFNYRTYDEIFKAIGTVNSLLSEIDSSKLEVESQGQDYHILRSGLFLYHAKNVFEDKNNSLMKYVYAKVVKKFIEEIPTIIVYNYDVFKRTAYDSELMYRLFNKGADEIYNSLDKYSTNGYVFHQWALYRARLGDYTNAFKYIERASRLLPGNFSIRNSKAMIIFDSNRKDTSEVATNAMRDAMEILSVCYKSDRRKNYHAIKYADSAIELAERGDLSYLHQAYVWVNEADPTNRYKRKEKLEQCMHHNNVSI